MKLAIRVLSLMILVSVALTISLLSFMPAPGDYEIVSIDAGDWLVSARAEDGSSLRFRMHPSIFEGRCFSANLTAVDEGERFDILGPQGERFDRLEARSVGQGSGRAGRGPARRDPSRPNARGMQRYCVTGVDAERGTFTASAAGSGQEILARVDSASFRGYRIQVPSLGELAAGGRFSLTTPNDAAVRCCTLLRR